MQSEREREVVLSCSTLCDPMDCSLPGSSVHGIFQARVCRGLPFPSPGDLSDPGIEPRSLAWQADSLPSDPPGNVIFNLFGLAFWHTVAAFGT